MGTATPFFRNGRPLSCIEVLLVRSATVAVVPDLKIAEILAVQSINTCLVLGIHHHFLAGLPGRSRRITLDRVYCIDDQRL